MIFETTTPSQKTKKILIIGSVGILIFTLWASFFRVPSAFPEQTRFTVNEYESLRSISLRLKEEGFITSSVLFRAAISFLGHDRAVQLGVYRFETPTHIAGVVRRFIAGPQEPLLSITIPEGSTTQEIAAIIKKAQPILSVDVFGELVYREQADGYLFPSTYYLVPSQQEADIINKMKATFDKQYEAAFKDKNYPRYVPNQKSVVSLAAILEGEAKGEEDMRIVSGILQTRLAQGMRLQVDVAEITYGEAGIPEQPINNPGLVAMNAVFDPIPTPYLYYITGDDGKMYYAKTFTEHKENIRKYLR